MARRVIISPPRTPKEVARSIIAAPVGPRDQQLAHGWLIAIEVGGSQIADALSRFLDEDELALDPYIPPVTGPSRRVRSPQEMAATITQPPAHPFFEPRRRHGGYVRDMTAQDCVAAAFSHRQHSSRDLVWAAVFSRLAGKVRELELQAPTIGDLPPDVLKEACR